MKVLQLMEELEEIAQNSSKVPLTGKALVDADEILEIIKEIRVELPDELQKAQWISDERARIIEEAEKERAAILTEARAKAEAMVEEDEITELARQKAEEIIANADLQSKNLKNQTFQYLDNVMTSMLERVEYAGGVYMGEMFDNLKKSFEQMSDILTENKTEIHSLAYQEEQRGRVRDTLDKDFAPIDEPEEDFDDEMDEDEE